MKTEILSEVKETEIDWGKRQWVRAILTEMIVLTDGNHNDNTFSGLALPHEGKDYGVSSITWNKKAFKPIPKEGLVIKITNE